MDIALKGIKYTAWSSYETHHFQATLYVDGKPLAIVSNEGHGGADEHYPHPKCAGNFRAKMRDVEEYFENLPLAEIGLIDDDGKPVLSQPDLESWCIDQINDWLTVKDIKRKLRSHILFTIAGKSGIYQSNKRPNPSRNATILNDLTIAEIVPIWLERAEA